MFIVVRIWCIFALLLSDVYGIHVTAPSTMVANQSYPINWTNNDHNSPFVLQRKFAGVPLDPSDVVQVLNSDKQQGTVTTFFRFVGDNHQFLALGASDRSKILGQSNNVSVVPDDGSSTRNADNQVPPSTTNFSVTPSTTQVEPEDSSLQPASETLHSFPSSVSDSSSLGNDPSSTATVASVSLPSSSTSSPQAASRNTSNKTAIITGTILGFLALITIIAIILLTIRHKRGSRWTFKRRGGRVSIMFNGDRMVKRKSERDFEILTPVQE